MQQPGSFDAHAATRAVRERIYADMAKRHEPCECKGRGGVHCPVCHGTGHVPDTPEARATT